MLHPAGCCEDLVRLESPTNTECYFNSDISCDRSGMYKNEREELNA